MEIYTIEIIEPKVKKLLDDLADLNLIKVQKTEKPKRKAQAASLVGMGEIVDDDLESASREISHKIKTSLENSARNLES